MSKAENLKIKAVVFDLDDTLAPEWQYQLSGFKFVSSYLSKKHGLDKGEVFSFLERDYFSGNREKNYDRLLSKFGIREDIKKLVTFHRRHKPDISFYPDAKYILSRLTNQFKLGLITDGDKYAQKGKIQSLGLANIIDAIIITESFKDDISYRKPGVKSFKKITQMLRLKPQEAIYIGDNPKKDFIGASRIGMRTIHIARKDGEYYSVRAPKSHQAMYKVEDLKDVLKIIEHLQKNEK